jgi:CelD/BcsL family acetyltransferase involved in cellulose biosynthesis
MIRRVQILTNETQFAEIRHEWNELVDQQKFPTVFYTWEWLNTWWNIVGTQQVGTSLYIILIYFNQKLVALAPFMEWTQNNLKNLHFLGDPYTDYHDILCHPNFEKNAFKLIIKHLDEHRNKWDHLHLNCIPSRSQTHLQFLSTGRYKRKLNTYCPIIDLQESAHVKDITKKRDALNGIKKLNAIGKVDYKHHFDFKSISDRFDAFVNMHMKQWDPSRNPVGSFNDPLVYRFFRALIHNLSKLHWIMFSELLVDDKPVAYYFSFLYKNRYWAYRPAFSIDMMAAAPGHVLLKNIIETLQDRNVTELDFLRGHYNYKYRYANDEIVNWSIFNEYNHHEKSI